MHMLNSVVFLLMLRRPCAIDDHRIFMQGCVLLIVMDNDIKITNEGIEERR